MRMRIADAWRFLGALSLGVGVLAQAPPQLENINQTGTSFLNHISPISSFFGQTFLRENIPYIDIPDSNIQSVYYYRWSALQRHLRYTTAGTGYIITEFVQPVGYAQAYNTIDAAAGHHIQESSWLRSNFYDDDYIQFWTRGPVDSNVNFLRAQLQGMLSIYAGWDYVYDASVGLYYFTPEFDAQELSLPGYVYAAQTHNSNFIYPGPQTYRPSLNAYMVANARAIAVAASLAGNQTIATNYTQFANALEQSMYAHLWDPAQQFFADVIRLMNPNLTPLMGREEVGFFPFRFGIGLQTQYAQPSMQELFDPMGFYTTYGPPTLEVRNQYYEPNNPNCCHWNGQSWPYSTSHTLKSLAAAIRAGVTNLTAAQYHQYLGIYATTQHKNGIPYVAESHYPDKDGWSGDAFNHSEHYAHSTNNDDVITGLLGLIPRADNNLQISPLVPANWTYFALENVAYHGHLVTFLYDVNGTRYHQGSGLTIFVDGQNIYNGNGMSATVALPNMNANRLTTTAVAEPIPVNIAANPLGLGAWPAANATYTFFYDDPYKSNDEYLFYDAEPDNRWTNYLSPNGNDTLQINFPRARNFSSVTLAIFSDVARGGQVDCPSAIEVYGSTGLITAISPFTCIPNDQNTINFGRTVTSNFIAVSMRNRAPYFVGLTEMQVWVPPNHGPTYYAVDAVLNSAHVISGTSSNATNNGAAVSNFGSGGGTIRFSGVYSSNDGRARLDLSYTASAATSVTYRINQVAGPTVTLAATAGGAFRTVSTSVMLLTGNNFVDVVVAGGGSGIVVDLMRVDDQSELCTDCA